MLGLIEGLERKDFEGVALASGIFTVQHSFSSRLKYNGSTTANVEIKTVSLVVPRGKEPYISGTKLRSLLD
jgi:hypothetical protein